MFKAKERKFWHRLSVLKQTTHAYYKCTVYENVACTKDSWGKSSIVYIAVGYPKANETVALHKHRGLAYMCKSRGNLQFHSTQVQDISHKSILSHTKASAGQEGI